MSNQKHLTYADVQQAVDKMLEKLPPGKLEGKKVYPIPRGGVPIGLMIKERVPTIQLVENSEHADIIVDDILDSGFTRKKYQEVYPDKPFLAPYVRTEENKGIWYVFPWEANEITGADICVRLLEFIGEDPKREGLQDTPKRFVEAWQEWCKGYTQDPADVLKMFEDGAGDYDQMVVVSDIPVYSHCEHHMAAIIGSAAIAYIPDGKIVGLSKLSRLVDVFAKRLQVQERLTSQIAEALVKHLKPKGVGVILKCRHMCMESRGICRPGCVTTTSAVKGVLFSLPEARAEFLKLTESLKA